MLETFGHEVVSHYSARRFAVFRFGLPMKQQVRFKVVLPIVQLALALGLFAIGQAEDDRIRWAAYDPITNTSKNSEGVRDIFKRARYADYAINAPAWFAQENTPWVLNIGGRAMLFGILDSESDWYYMLYVVLMWFGIGVVLDRLFRSHAATDFLKKSWGTQLISLALVGYGLLMIWTHPRLGPLRQYENWFIASIFVWGFGLIFAGIYGLKRRNRISHVTPDYRRNRTRNLET